MHLSCECLNISIVSKNVSFSEFDTNVSDSFTNHQFFNEEIGKLSLCSIHVQIPDLKKEIESGVWKIALCLNCNDFCYGVCKSLGFGSLLARKNLEVDTNKINRLKRSESYSPIFKILISQSDISSDDEAGGDEKLSLHPTAASWLDEQTALTEERVKVFTEKEYAALDDLRKRAYKEQKVINRREKEEEKQDRGFFVGEPAEHLPAIAHKTIRKHSVSKSSVEDASFDAEGVFLLDGFEDKAVYHLRSEESDSDESDDLTTFHPRRMGAAQLAKSLPIPVPMFMEDKHQNDPLFGSPEVPTDIAASIKALAKSIHGDAIFGELPPPRFSTNL